MVILLPKWVFELQRCISHGAPGFTRLCLYKTGDDREITGKEISILSVTDLAFTHGHVYLDFNFLHKAS